MQAVKPFEIGDKFNDLKIVDLLENHKSTSHQEYKCKCICGAFQVIKHYQLIRSTRPSKCCSKCSRVRQGIQRTATTRSKIPVNVPNQSPVFNMIYASIKRNALDRGLTWCLTKEDVAKLIFANCEYCDAPPSNVIKEHNRKCEQDDLVKNGIDRIDNSKGYTVENCATCCAKCNTLKGAITKEMVYKVAQLLTERSL